MSNPVRPPHLRWGLIGLVAAGGALGTAAREGLTLVPAFGDTLLVIAAVNVLGAFLLGLLLEALNRPHRPGALRARLLLGTGFCGGFTTYSALATDSALLLRAEQLGTALAYALGTLLLGALATWLGLLAGSRLAAPSGDDEHAGHGAGPANGTASASPIGSPAAGPDGARG